MSNFKYKTENNLQQRKDEAERILKQYNNRMPIICEVAPNSKLPPLKKFEYIVPGDMTLTQFQFLIRRNLDLNELSALYLITNNVTLTGDRTMREIYNTYKDKEDKFLYIFYDSELTWG